MTHEVHIGKTTVQFPYEPYSVQKKYMTQLISALESGSNALLESPTGTGKSLSLLCSALAWSQSQESPGMIIYATRTHSQLTQIVKELSKTMYKPKVSLLASRKHLCVHPEVRHLTGSDQVTECNARVKKRRCTYHSNTQDKNLHDGTVRDIEDLVSMGQASHVCPYYFSASQLQGAELVLLPYNYLVDPKFRQNLKRLSSRDGNGKGLALHDAVVIFDEAHNIERVAEDVMSKDISVKNIIEAVNQLQSVIQHNTDSSIRDRLMSLKTSLVDMQKLLLSIPLGSQPGDAIFPMLSQCGFSSSAMPSISELVDTVALEQQASVEALTVAQLRHVIDMVGSILETMQSDFEHFKVHVYNQTNQQYEVSGSPKVLGFWCLSPSVAMKGITSKGTRSVILTSGTLSPLDSIALEFGMAFPIRLENSHVISSNQLHVSVVKTGPSGQKLNSSYANRSDTRAQLELGNALVNFCRVIPDGVLVFFPSYAALDSSITSWMSHANGKSVLGRLGNFKPVIIEKRGYTMLEYDLMIDKYRRCVASGSGGILFTVCRGKSSEGIDFANESCRGVVLTGIPYPSLKSDKVKLKRDYLDSRRNKLLSGKTWYSQQAMRAANQAIGRVIRHKDDFGAILLCDERFEWSSNQQGISKWIQPFITTAPQFGRSTRDLIQFFRQFLVSKSPARAKPPSFHQNIGYESNVELTPVRAKKPKIESLLDQIPPTPEKADENTADSFASKLIAKRSIAVPSEEASAPTQNNKPPTPAAVFFDDITSVCSVEEAHRFQHHIIAPLHAMKASGVRDSKTVETFRQHVQDFFSKSHTEGYMNRFIRFLPRDLREKGLHWIMHQPVSAKEFRQMVKRELSSHKVEQFKVAASKLRFTLPASPAAMDLLRQIHSILGNRLFLLFGSFVPKQHHDLYRSESIAE